MHRSPGDDRVAAAAIVLMVAVSMLAALLGHTIAGFMLFLAAATPLPPLVAVQARRWMNAKRQRAKSPSASG